MRFEQSKGIAVDGIVGRVTWINIDEADQNEPVLRNGSTGRRFAGCKAG